MNRWMPVAIGCAAVVALVGLVGCGGEDDGAGTGGDPALVGLWRMTSMSVDGGPSFPPASIGWDVQMQFNADGSAAVAEVWNGSNDSNGGGWSAGGGVLNIAAGWYQWTSAYTVSGNRLTLANVPNYDGEGHTGAFVFSR